MSIFVHMARCIVFFFMKYRQCFMSSTPNIFLGSWAHRLGPPRAQSQHHIPFWKAPLLLVRPEASVYARLMLWQSLVYPSRFILKLSLSAFGSEAQSTTHYHLCELWLSRCCTNYNEFRKWHTENLKCQPKKGSHGFLH